MMGDNKFYKKNISNTKLILENELNLFYTSPENINAKVKSLISKKKYDTLFNKL